MCFLRKVSNNNIVKSLDNAIDQLDKKNILLLNDFLNNYILQIFITL